MGSGKKVADAVHGTIALTEVETSIVGSPAFQRLRGIRQLGLAHYVYPGAGYSRFEHSLGACHLVKRALRSIHEAQPHHKIGDDPRLNQKYALAALLHDVGHYPFSHATEHALKEYHSRSLTKKKGEPGDSPPTDVLSHEQAGDRVLLHDPHINKALEQHGYTAKDISSIFRREEVDQLAGLISSDLDVDRIDYLLRTAHGTGLPYGLVDVDYLISEVRLDKERQPCFSKKALRACEHLLLARYFDYRQVAFHKAVAGFEEALKYLLSALIARGALALDEGQVVERIKTGTWSELDDAYVIAKIRELNANSAAGSDEAAFCNSILQRRPPVVLFSEEWLGPRQNGDRSRLVKRVADDIQREATNAGVPAARLILWSRTSSLTKMGPNVPFSAALDAEKTQAGIAQSIRILNDDGSSSEIMGRRASLMSVLADQTLSSIRLYWFPNDQERQRRQEIEALARRVQGDALDAT